MSVIETPRATLPRPIVYPDGDGKPMADNTEQFEWIVTIKEGTEELLADDPNVFVAGDLLWYPVEGDPRIATAPDTMVAFGRPKGRRGSYKQWEEGGIAPQVVVEVLSPNNRPSEMQAKLEFYERYGVEEYYLFDPDKSVLKGWLREGGLLRPIAAMEGWTSPRLGVRFELGTGKLRIIRPDGRAYRPFQELAKEATQARQDQLDALERERVALAGERLAREAEEAARREAQNERTRAERLAERLRALGIDPELDQGP